MIDGIKNTLLIALLASVIGFAAGYTTSQKFQKAAAEGKLAGNLKETAQNVVTSTVESQAIETKVEHSGKAVTATGAAIKTRLGEQEKKYEAEVKEAGGAQVCPKPFVALDTGTVRLLNAARAGASVGPASGSNEAGAAPSASAGK